MNTALMTQIQTLIYSNQDKLEQLVEALESVCELGNTIVAPKAKHPLEGYTISEKDIGSVVTFGDSEGTMNKDGLLTDFATNRGSIPYEVVGCHWRYAVPYTNTVKLHFRPFHATKDSAMPSQVLKTDCIAMLFSNGTIDVTNSPDSYYWKDDGDGCCVIIGYQILSFVNPVLEK